MPRPAASTSPRTVALLLARAAVLVPPMSLQAQASLVILVRHAEKAGASGDVALTPAGEARAAALVPVLANTRLDAVIATQFQRTRRTAEPVASSQGLTPQLVPAGNDVQAHAAAVARAVDRLPPGSAVFVVGHSNTLGPIIAALGGPLLPDLCDGEYSTLFTLERGNGSARLIRSRFGVVDPAGADQCGEER